jgi:hypothetical protein
MTRQSSTSPVLIAIILIITFPVWFSIAALLFGLAAGFFGLVFGLIGGLFGLIIGIIAFPFKLIFGSDDWGWHPFHFHGFHSDGWFIIAVIILVVFALKKK